MLYIQLIGLLAFCVLVLSYYKKNTVTILVYQITANFAYAVHYFLLGGLSGAFNSVISIIRNIIFINSKDNKRLLSIIFIMLYLLVTIVFYENFYSVFPMIANSLYLLSLVSNNRKSIIIGGILDALFWLLYSIFVFSYVGVITELILIISNTIQLLKLNKSNAHK